MNDVALLAESFQELDEESRELNQDASARIFRVLAAIKMLGFLCNFRWKFDIRI